MKRYIPYEKLSAKKQREINSVYRNTWTRSPVTRVKPSGKIYNRKKAPKGFIKYSFLCLLFFSRLIKTLAELNHGKRFYIEY